MVCRTLYITELCETWFDMATSCSKHAAVLSASTAEGAQGRNIISVWPHERLMTACSMAVLTLSAAVYSV